MGYTEGEFIRVLDGGFSGAASGLVCTGIAKNVWRIDLTAAEASLQLNIRQNPPRQLGSLEIPVLLVSFGFIGFSALQKKSFLGRFNRYFHKGGG